MQKREFHFEEGTSRKFWSVATEGADLLIHFGRLGTAGQAQRKTLADAAAAEREAAKLVTEKTRKDYVEQSVGAAPSVAVSSRSDREQTAVALNASKAGKGGQKELAATDGSSIAEAKKGCARSEQELAATSLTRTIRLDPEDYFLRSWESHPPLTRKPSPPFDPASALERLAAVGPSYAPDWRRAKIPAWPSVEEAQFWVHAYSSRCSSSELVQKYTKQPPVGMPTPTQLFAACDGYHCIDRLRICALRLMTFGQLVRPPDSWAQYPMVDLAQTFREHFLPYLTADEREELRRAVAQTKVVRYQGKHRAHWTPSAWVRALLGFHEEMEKQVRTLPTAASYEYAHLELTPWIIFGLGSPERVQAEFARIGIYLEQPAEARAWLALTGLAGLAEFARSACASEDRERVLPVAKVLLRVQAPEAAPVALRILQESVAKAVGLEWLQKYPLEAAVGLVPLALGGGPLAGPAREQLQILQAGGALPADAGAHLSAEQADWLQREIIAGGGEVLPPAALSDLPEALRQALQAVKNPKPVFLPPATLPPIRLGSTRLGPAEVGALLHVLKGAELGTPLPLVTALQQHADRQSLDLFAWHLAETWLGLGAPNKEKWALQAAGYLGGDQCVLRLTPLVRAWPGESQHQRAVLGLQVLRAIGTDTALMALNGIALKLKFRALKEKAQTLMEEIAASRGFTREQLADRVVPDCDLDERGSRTFDFGPRQFTFVLGPEMKPLVRDAAGKLRPDLPAANASDDAVKAEEAGNDWKLLKKTLREVLKVQADRLEDAMISGRRWSAEEFHTLLVGHPLMVNLVRQFVFGAYDEAGKVVQTFRLTEDRTLANAKDEPVQKIATDRVGLVHPAQLEPAALAAWGQVLGDYEIIPPFPQLGRPICEPDPADRGLTALTRFKGPKIPGIVVFGTLERANWSRDIPADGGGFRQHSKHFPGADVTAFIQYSPGLAVSYYEEPQQISEVYFVPGHVKPEYWGEHKNRRKVGEIDRVVLSEVLRVVEAMLAKA